MVWAVPLSTTEFIPRRLTPRFWLVAFVVRLELVRCYLPNPSGALPPLVNLQGCTSIHFGEYQLSLGSFGISPLSTAHLTALQR